MTYLPTVTYSYHVHSIRYLINDMIRLCLDHGISCVITMSYITPYALMACGCNSEWITCVQWDGYGSLVAAGSRSSRICIYDMMHTISHYNTHELPAVIDHPDPPWVTPPPPICTITTHDEYVYTNANYMT
jgi:WD40 repeat protein